MGRRRKTSASDSLDDVDVIDLKLAEAERVFRSDTVAAERMVLESIDLATSAQDCARRAYAIYLHAILLARLGRYAEPRVAIALTNIGVALGSLNRHDEALASLERAITIAEKHRDWKLVTSALSETGRIAFRRGDWQRALEANERAFSAQVQYNDHHG